MHEGLNNTSKVEFLKGSLVEVFGHKLESSQAQVFVWLSIPAFLCSTKCYS